MRVISLFEKVFEGAAAKGFDINLPEGGEVEGIGIAEEKEAIGLAQFLQQLDAFGRKVEQEGVPAVDDRLVRDGHKSRQSFDRVNELTVAYPTHLVFLEERRGMAVSKIAAN